MNLLIFWFISWSIILDRWKLWLLWSGCWMGVFLWRLLLSLMRLIFCVSLSRIDMCCEFFCSGWVFRWRLFVMLFMLLSGRLILWMIILLLMLLGVLFCMVVIFRVCLLVCLWIICVWCWLLLLSLCLYNFLNLWMIIIIMDYCLIWVGDLILVWIMVWKG